MNGLLDMTTRERAARGWGFLLAAVGLSAGAVALFVLLQALTTTGLFLLAVARGDGGASYVRPMHLEMHLRSQVLAVTGLASVPGPWSTSVDAGGIQVLSKGGASRVVPVPVGMDLPGEPDDLRSTIVVGSSGEGAVIRVANLGGTMCRGLFTRNNLSRFTEGPLEYSTTGRGDWVAYAGDLDCGGTGPGDLWLRPARVEAMR